MSKRTARPSDLMAEATALVKAALQIRFTQNPARDPNWHGLRDELLAALATGETARAPQRRSAR